MSKLIIYHGSTKIIKQPIFKKGKTYNDYGQGFYCTKKLELAKEWACNEGEDGYANKYEIETKNLRVLNLLSNEYNILNWLAILMQNRKVSLYSAIAKQGRDYLINNFLPNYQDYDIIIGYRADDSYFLFARAFVSNEISLKQLNYAMKLGKLGEQVVLKSKKAFETIKFIDYTLADSSNYYVKRKIRDNKARLDYQKHLEKDDIEGIYIRDIIKEKIKQNDPRLR